MLIFGRSSENIGVNQYFIEKLKRNLNMKTTIILIAVIIITSIGNAQITKDNIKQLLIAQGVENAESQAASLYDQYTDNKQIDVLQLNKALGESALSGISMGLYQSRNACYKNTSWMPKFMQDWYSINVKTDKIYGKSLTWQKIWREADYMNDRLAYEDLNKFFDGKWYFAAVTHMFVKNLTGAMIRNKMSNGRLL
jgi:hypothetical protein